jgi:hypothetical protein
MFRVLGYSQAPPQALPVHNPVSLSFPEDLGKGAPNPFGWMPACLGPQHVQIDVEKAARQVWPGLHQSRMVSAPPKRSFPLLPPVVIACNRPLKKMHAVGDRTSVFRPQEEMNMVACDHVRQYVHRVATRHFMQAKQVVPSVFYELQKEIAPMATVRDVVAKGLRLVALSSSHAVLYFSESYLDLPWSLVTWYTADSCHAEKHNAATIWLKRSFTTENTI